MGLVAEPSEPHDLAGFSHVDEEGEIAIFIEAGLLAPPHLKKGELLVNIEGWGRFRLEFPEHPEG